MGKAVITCQRCFARKFESEVVFDTNMKDFVCRDAGKCKASTDRQSKPKTRDAWHKKRKPI